MPKQAPMRARLERIFRPKRSGSVQRTDRWMVNRGNIHGARNRPTPRAVTLTSRIGIPYQYQLIPRASAPTARRTYWAMDGSGLAQRSRRLLDLSHSLFIQD